MAKAYKRLGAVAVAATADTTLYTCPGSTTTITSCIHVCNRASTQQTFRIAIIDGPISGVATKDFLFFDAVIPRETGLSLNIGAILEAAYTIMVRSDSSDVNFIAFGAEIT